MNALIRPKSIVNILLTGAFALALVFAFGPGTANAQSLTINFRFDPSDPGYVAATPSSMALDSSASGQSFTIDIWATIVGASPATTTAQQSQLGLSTVFYRGASSSTNNTAFTTGGTVGVVAGSFVAGAPFSAPATGSTLGTVSDIGKTASGATLTTGADGILDFGGTSVNGSTNAISNSDNFTYEVGGGANGGQASSTQGWEFKLGTFKFQVGTVNASGTTTFLPLVSSNSAASSSIWTTDGGTTNLSGKITPGSSVSFTAAGAVTGALEDNSNTHAVFGPPQAFTVAGSGPYNVVDSSVVGQVAGTTGGSTAFPPIGVGGRARILAGTNSSATVKAVTMGWRSRLVPSESPGPANVVSPGTTSPLLSDVVDVQGLGNPSDPFVLDMTYNPALLPKHNAPGIEAGLANNKLIYMVSPTTGVDGTQYENTVLLNTGNIVTSPLDARYGYKGSYATFQSAGQPGNGLTPAQELGAWGVDTALHEVWAVVNHNSTFAVVPEPSTMLLAGFGLLSLVGLRRRMKKVA